MPGIKLNFMVIFRERIFKQFVENLFKKCKKTENENKIKEFNNKSILNFK